MNDSLTAHSERIIAKPICSSILAESSAARGLAELSGVERGDYFFDALNAALEQFHYPQSQSLVIWMPCLDARCTAAFFEDSVKYGQLVRAGAAIETHDAIFFGGRKHLS